MYTHTREKPFICGIDGCEEKFRQRGKRSIHQREAHSKNFLCAFFGHGIWLYIQLGRVAVAVDAWCNVCEHHRCIDPFACFWANEAQASSGSHNWCYVGVKFYTGSF